MFWYIRKHLARVLHQMLSGLIRSLLSSVGRTTFKMRHRHLKTLRNIGGEGGKRTGAKDNAIGIWQKMSIPPESQEVNLSVEKQRSVYNVGAREVQRSSGGGGGWGKERRQLPEFFWVHFCGCNFPFFTVTQTQAPRMKTLDLWARGAV